ncbi:MAG: phosphotransferase [Microbacterium sp.]|nr:phosphotransferase [Microbacterium sp.]
MTGLDAPVAAGRRVLRVLAADDDRRLLLAEGGVVLKQWARPHERVDREIAALEMLQAAGVAAPRPLWVAHTDRDGVLLAMAAVPGMPLESALGSASPLDARRVLGSLLESAGAWLEAGVAHGGLRAGDVLIDDTGAVSVVGWGDATIGPGAPRPSAGQRAWFGTTDAAAADVLAAGALLARFAGTDDLLHRLATALAAEPTIDSLQDARRQLCRSDPRCAGETRRLPPQPPLADRVAGDAADAEGPEPGSIDPATGSDRPPLLLDEPAPTVVRDGRAAEVLAAVPHRGLLGAAERILHPSIVDGLGAVLASARAAIAAHRRRLLAGGIAFALSAGVALVALRQLSPASDMAPMPEASVPEASAPEASMSQAGRPGREPAQPATRASTPREAAPALLRAWASCETAVCARRYAAAEALLPDPPLPVAGRMRVARVQRVGDLALVDVRTPAGHAAISIVETDHGWRLRAYSPPPSAAPRD